MNQRHRNILLGIVLSGLLMGALSYTACKTPQMTRSGAVAFPDRAAHSDSRPAGSLQISLDSLFLEAERQKMQGNFSEAGRLFHLVLKEAPQNATAWYELALLNGRAKKAEATLQYARRAATLDSDNPWYQIAFANALAMNEAYDSAAAVFHRLSARYPTQDSYLYNEAVMLSSAEKYDEALDLFSRLEERAGVNEEFVYQKQRIYLRKNMPDSAAAEIRKIIDLYPENPRFYRLLAQVYTDNDQPAKAMRVYQTLLKKHPGNPHALVALGVYYKNRGDDSAYRHYMTQAFANPQFDLRDKIAFVYPYLKYIEVDSTKKEEALFLCRLITGAHPDEAAAHTLYGEMLFQSGATGNAAREFRTAIALDSSTYEPWNQLMLLYATQGKNDSLQAASRLASHRFPQEGGVWYFYGMASFFKKQYDSTVQMLHRSLALGVTDKTLKSRIYSVMGEAYHLLGKTPLSDSCFRFSLQLNPRDAYTLNNFSYLLAERGAHLGQALTMIKAAVALEPDIDVFEDTYAWVLFRMGEFEEAQYWIEKALQHPGAEDHPGYLEHYGDILYRNRQTEKAVQYWQQAKAKGGNTATLRWKIKHKKIPGKPAKKQSGY